ncbi:cyanophycin synthetase [Acidovorax sp. SRB_14]|uniref:cyanophycin synthetase n=1 Tax=unclassified Acidovorax TaxID=2684926 RepID=UPI00145C736C|nr:MULTISPECIES: cyanophycin synthetase [unclassified Acidovorax]NMM77295.1 cyanophycin synthetase [Acidovorax sp. SRB_24]NMM80177.1 cyanophycin synthetase [Acidovorax sp. SRB_14]NMM89828.1 cyanophycin synthetase [Rhodococcus sp. SRB_17]
MEKIKDIELLRINYLRGPNIWTYRPVLEVWLDLGALEDCPSHKLPGFNDRLTTWLPALVEHHCGVGERGGFLQRLQEGTWCGHVLEHVVIELLNLAGMPTGFGQTRSTSQRGVYRMVFRAREEQVARMALQQGHRLIMAAINDEPFDVAAAVARVRTEVDDRYLGPSTACIVTAAADRGIPHIRLNDGNLVQLGYGAAQRRIWTAESEFTSAIAEGIASDKDLTKGLLKACGVPVPEGQVVDSPEAAWEAAQDIGLPVVVKPSNGNHGRGVTLDLRRREDIEAAWHVAEPEGSEVMVERFIPGDEHRLLVVGGKVVAAARGELVSITGNGRSTVRELVDSQLNSDPRRGYEEEYPLEIIDLATDSKVQLELKRQELDADAVPAAGRQVVVQRNGNVAVDCTDEVHPEVAYIAQLAARVVGLDIAGIDMVAQDISRPLHAQSGAIVEVNAGPGLLMHLKPAVGAPRPVGQAIAEHLFPIEEGKSESDAGRIPVVGVAGSRDTSTLARLVAWLVHLSGRYTGLACKDGMFMNERRVDTRDCADWEGAHRLLMSQMVQAAVIENDARTILRDGLAYDRCTVGVVTDMDGAHDLGMFDIQEPEQMARVLRTQVDVVLPSGAAVLNADEPQVAALARLCDGAVILYSTDAQNPAIAAHRAADQGRAVLLHGGHVVLASGSSEKSLGAPERLGFGHDTPTLLAAIAAAWALDIAPDLIAAGIKTFEPGLSASGSPRTLLPL